MKRLKYYFKIWWLMSRNSFLMVLTQRLGVMIFLIGKIIRFVFFLMFLFFLLKGTNTLAGYSLNQTLFFFLSFNLVDVLSQFFFREVYRFRPLVVSGGFDLILSKPSNALFRVLLGGADVIDLITIPPLFFAVFYFGKTLDPALLDVLLYVLLIINGLIIATAFHIAVLGLGIITLEIDHTVMIYRDVVSLGRLPIDIYKEPLRGFLTYLVPVGLMVTIPVKALMGLVSPFGIIISCVVAGATLFASIRFWNFALKKYTSASS